MTGKEMCETIARAHARLLDLGQPSFLPSRWDHIHDIEPMAIWNSSPTGELFHVFGWYDIAVAVLEGFPAET